MMEGPYIDTPIFIAQPIYHAEQLNNTLMLPQACRDSLSNAATGCTDAMLKPLDVSQPLASVRGRGLAYLLGCSKCGRT